MLAWGLRARTPAAVRRLPEGDAILYVDFRPLRSAGLLTPSAVPKAPAYAGFVRQSGFDFERDLDTLALSLDGPPTAPADATCILSGRFGPGFTAYLAAHALRRQTVAGLDAFIFPGWARPGQRLAVVPLGSGRFLVTNRPDPSAAVAHARSWWPSPPSLWHASGWLPAPPAGYAAANLLHLAADRALDGSVPPWRGAETLELRLGLTLSGAALQGVETTASPADAAAALRFFDGQRQALATLLAAGDPPPANAAALSAALKNLRLSQQGASVRFTLRLDRSLLAPSK